MLVNLCLAMAIGVILCALNILINFSQVVMDFFAGFSRFPITNLLINGLFVWLAGLMVIAFLRWREAERTREELEDIISSISPDALLVVTPDRKIVMCNASVERMFGYAGEEVLRGTTDTLYYDRRVRKDVPHEIYAALEEAGFHIGMATGKRKDGSAVPLEIITGELSDGSGAVVLLRDITERIRAEDERMQMRERMRERKNLESLGVLAGGIAHDFNNLLAGMLGNAELCRQYFPEGHEGREGIEEVITGAQRAADLCRGMLAYAGRGRLALVPLDLSETVESKPGEGSTFAPLFPRSDRPAEGQSKKEPSEASGAAGDGTVLVIEDERAILRFLKRQIQDMGFRVLLASGGREGLRLFREHASEITLVLLDMAMPDVSGETVFHEIRQIRRDANVIFSSGYITSRHMELGADAIIQKPYESSVLREKIMEVLGRRS
jgi:PAS domain S-box-containing protein